MLYYNLNKISSESCKKEKEYQRMYLGQYFYADIEKQIYSLHDNTEASKTYVFNEDYKLYITGTSHPYLDLYKKCISKFGSDSNVFYNYVKNGIDEAERGKRLAQLPAIIADIKQINSFTSYKKYTLFPKDFIHFIKLHSGVNKFIVIEGCDGIGKDTLIDHIINSEYGLDKLLYTREPGGNYISESIRNILLDVTNSNMCKETETLLYSAARSQYVDTVNELLLSKDVISSRYAYSSIYQKLLQTDKDDIVNVLNEYAIRGLYPDAVISCYMDSDSALISRMRNSDPDFDRIETRSDDYFIKINNYYRTLEPLEYETIYHFDVSGTKEQNNEKIDRLMKMILNII